MDINSCTPVSNAAVDFWHANATGVYGGVVSPINGDVNDHSNLQNKMLRGIQVSDQDGVVELTSIFPGHYGGRAVHVHILAQLNATQLANKTVTGGTTAHVGQLYFDMDLINEVRKVEPYAGNQQALVENDKDILLRMSAANGADPVVEYTFLGPSISDGIFAWINFGINGTNVRTPYAAVGCSEGGCVANPDKGPFAGFGKGFGKGVEALKGGSRRPPKTCGKKSRRVRKVVPRENLAMARVEQ
ncbi:hypothetical protein LTS18_006010 [Coniosporium uncinatum]|uniref:Uncharacterized protein n=1 Tax=Coniosporium uncinatum TaxID=93489 RepID=A0ACC3DQW9_9PEZI|nr:hypothetical protein LTS18_006010 [Coniosporium uncinatum]